MAWGFKDTWDMKKGKNLAESHKGRSGVIGALKGREDIEKNRLECRAIAGESPVFEEKTRRSAT